MQGWDTGKTEGDRHERERRGRQLPDDISAVLDGDGGDVRTDMDLRRGGGGSTCLPGGWRGGAGRRQSAGYSDYTAPTRPYITGGEEASLAVV